MYKKSALFFTAAITMLTSCSGLPGTRNVRSYIPGIYARVVNNEFSVGHDTLIISELSKAGNNYGIIHRAAFQKIDEGKSSKIERKNEVWTAVYNDQEKLLHETVKGKIISFNPEARSLYVGTSEYKKISP